MAGSTYDQQQDDDLEQLHDDPIAAESGDAATQNTRAQSSEHSLAEIHQRYPTIAAAPKAGPRPRRALDLDLLAMHGVGPEPPRYDPVAASHAQLALETGAPVSASDQSLAEIQQRYPPGEAAPAAGPRPRRALDLDMLAMHGVAPHPPRFDPVAASHAQLALDTRALVSARKARAGGDAPRGEAGPQAAAESGAGAVASPRRLTLRDLLGRRAAGAPNAAESASPPPSDSDAKPPLQELAPHGAQALATGAATNDHVHEAAQRGVAGAGSALPHLDVIQPAFGRHDISGVQAHVGGGAATASRAIGAEAYATGNHVAFAGAPSLHTAAHEAAHVVQQRGGVQLKGGVGESGDVYEQHANDVADAVVQGKSAEGLLDRYAGGASSSGVAVAGVQRKETSADQSPPASSPAPKAPKSDVAVAGSVSTANGEPATAATKPTEHVDTTINDSTRVESVEMLHAEEIFADVPANTVAKKHAFDRLSKAVQLEKKAKARVAAAAAAASKPKANAKTTAAATAKAAAALTAAQADVVSATQAVQSFIANTQIQHDKELKSLKAKLAAAKKKKKPDAAEIAEVTKAIEARKSAIRDEVADLNHGDAGHTDDSVFAPVETDVTHHDFAFADGEHVKVHDHVVSYATTVSFGVDSEGPIDHKQVKDVMATAGLSESRRKILQAISGFEGGFDTVNTYDRAKVTWGFVQWTGGSASDLTQTLTIIKAQHADAFAKNFQAYGIDVVGDQLVITPPDGSPAIKGDKAADAIMRNPRLAAVLAHAGRNDEVQRGEVQAASQLEVDNALSMKIHFDADKKKISTTAAALITSEYGVGLLANTFVHSGSGAAASAAHAAVVGYVSEHPYVAGDEAWRTGAEAAIVTALAARDRDRADSLRKLLDTASGSFK